MAEKPVTSEILKDLKQTVLEDLLDEETLSVMLVGSWVDGTAKEFSDIDKYGYYYATMVTANMRRLIQYE